jgi:predicted nucleotidyltransferase
VEQLASDLVGWAGSHEDVDAVALVGSYARGTAGMASDVDIVILTARFAQLAEDVSWFARLRPGSELIRAKAWGPLLERRFRLRTGVHVELGLVSPSWAELPLDLGTRRVLADGHRVLYDQHGLLSNAGEAVKRSSRMTAGYRDAFR